MTKPIDSHSYFVSYEFYEDTLTCAIAQLLNDGVELEHPVISPDEFGDQINSTVFNRLQYFGQNGIQNWCEDLRPIDFIKAEWFTKGACIEGANISDFLD